MAEQEQATRKEWISNMQQIEGKMAFPPLPPEIRKQQFPPELSETEETAKSDEESRVMASEVWQSE